MVTVILLAYCNCSFALDQSSDISQYAHTAWKVRDGFAKGAIRSIAQTPDGYLWLATDFGLLRFDGVRAVPWQLPGGEQLSSNFVGSLLVAHDGTLWIGSLKGLASWKDGKLTRYPEVEGAIVGSFLEDRAQTVWFGTHEPSKARLCAIRSGKVECYGAGRFGSGVIAVYEDHRHTLWVSAQTGLWRWVPSPLQRYAFPRGVTEANSLIEDDAGTLMLATNAGLKQLVAGRIENYPPSEITGQLRPNRFFRSSDGSLWVGTQQGLLHVHQGRVDGFRAVNGLSGDSVDRIYEDREGSIWVATLNGLDRFREYEIPTVSRDQGLSNNPWSVQATSDGSIWVGMADGLNRWANGRMTLYRGGRALGQNRRADDTDLDFSGTATKTANRGFVGTPHSLGLDDEGRLWASTNDRVFYFDGGRFVRVSGAPGGYTFSIAGDGHGNVWILQGGNLFHWSPKAAVQQISWSEFAQKSGRTMIPDREPGAVWLGFLEGGLVYLKDGKAIRYYGPAEGLGDGRVNHLRFGSRDGVWAATEGGLSRIKNGHIETLTSKNGLPCDEVHWSMEDEDHNIWVYMPCGLARIERSEWYAWVDNPKHAFKTTLFDNSDGVGGVGVYGSIGPHVTKSPDGRIWFVSFDGVSVLDPRHLLVNKLPPPVHIEQITADGKQYDAKNGLRLPPRVRGLTVDYTALSLVVPEKVRFRIKLEGQDTDWRELVNVRHVEYTNLAPRNYSFRVLAANNSGVWNETGDTLEFSLAPAYWQTNWFRALCAAAFLALFWVAYQLRVRQLAREFEMRLQERVGERTRIARELHDTLLQSFHGLLMSFQSAARALPERPVEAKERLEGAIGEAHQAITEGRDAVQGLRMSATTTNDLAQAIGTLAKQLAANAVGSTAPAFRLDITGGPRALHPIIRDEVYRIGGEALRNAFRYSEAQRIEVEIQYDAKRFRVSVRDDGKGIDPAILGAVGKEGHFGLPGMRERAWLMGAKLEVWSEVGAGAEVELSIPAAIAYASARQVSWWRRLSRKARVGARVPDSSSDD